MGGLATPSGFRDVLTDEATAREAIINDTQRLLAAHGYKPIETPTLEVMDLLSAGRSHLAAPLKFFDARGDLLALRPDVTLQVARIAGGRALKESQPLRLRYTQRVFRESESEAYEAPRELTQLGVEYIGAGGVDADSEVAALLCEVLDACGLSTWQLSLANVGVLRSLLERSGGSQSWQQAVLQAFHDSDFVALAELCAFEGARDFGGGRPAPAFADAIAELPWIQGGREAIERVAALAAPLGCDAGLDELASVFDDLSARGFAPRIDFSVMSSFDYYTGLVFVADCPFMSEPLGAGGRYDGLLGSFGADRPAAGFAFTLEAVMEAQSRKRNAEAPGVRRPDTPLRIAVPKGALNAGAIEALAEAGLDTEGLRDPGRLMVIHTTDIDYIIVRPSDAPIFVALGGADCGICGEDSLVESGADVVELVDLGFGGCRFVVAEPAGSTEAIEERYRTLGSYRVATKYPKVARAHFARTGTQVEIVRLHGNIELAPLVGLSERIVDITATGTTLRDNDLVIVEDVMDSTARFFANPCAWRTDGRLRELADAMKGRGDIPGER